MAGRRVACGKFSGVWANIRAARSRGEGGGDLPLQPWTTRLGGIVSWGHRLKYPRRERRFAFVLEERDKGSSW